MKKVISILLIGIFILTACSTEDNSQRNTINDSTSSENNNQNEIIHEYCTRSGNAGDNATAELTYDIYYVGDVLVKLSSREKVTSNDTKILDTYENAYKKIHSYYKELEYYETNVVRENNSVASIMNIQYDKINIEMLISIEGAEDNIFENNIPKVSKWKEFAKKLGTKCEKV